MCQFKGRNQGRCTRNLIIATFAIIKCNNLSANGGRNKLKVTHANIRISYSRQKAFELSESIGINLKNLMSSEKKPRYRKIHFLSVMIGRAHV